MDDPHTHTHTPTQSQGQNVTVLGILERLEFFLIGKPSWPTILFSVPWPLHFEIPFAGPGKEH